MCTFMQYMEEHILELMYLFLHDVFSLKESLKNKITSPKQPLFFHGLVSRTKISQLAAFLFSPSF